MALVHLVFRRRRFAGILRARASRLRWAAALVAVVWLGGLPAGGVAGTLVNVNTEFGTIQLDLFDDLVPETVANFLSYVNDGAYADTLIHRSVSLSPQSGIGVIQGGGFAFNAGAFTPIQTMDPIALQYNRANTRGTIAMARQGDPNTATSQWFINTDEINAVNLAPGGFSADGYAVFGWVVGAGMDVVDAIHAVPTFNGVNGFNDVPLEDYSQGNPVQLNNVVLTNSVTVVGTHASFQNPAMSADVVNDGLLRASDAHALFNELLSKGSHSVSGPFSGTHYVDITGDSVVDILDAHALVNALLSGQSPPPAVSPLMARSLAMVPEPSSFALCAAGLTALAAGAWWRRRRGRPSRGSAC